MKRKERNIVETVLLYHNHVNQVLIDLNHACNQVGKEEYNEVQELKCKVQGNRIALESIN